MFLKLHKKIVGTAAAALFIASMFFSIIYLAHELNHECCHGHCRDHHDECPVCALLQASAAIILGFAFSFAVAAISQTVKPLKSVFYVRTFFAHDTLISRKIKLTT